MDFSGISSKSTIGKILRAPLGLIPDSTVVPIIQGPLRGKRWIVGSSNHGCWLGSYEFPKQQIFTQHIKPGQVIYDIGAHVGFYTLLSAHLVGDQGKVIAFEPFPENAEYIKKHLQLNNITNVRLFEKAVSDHSGKATFKVGASSSMGHLSQTETPDRSITVDIVTVDEFINREQLPIPDVMKIDIEGEEFNFLQGAKKLLADNAVKLFIATHGNEVHQQCMSFLRDNGYAVTSLNNQPLESTDEIMATKSSQDV